MREFGSPMACSMLRTDEILHFVQDDNPRVVPSAAKNLAFVFLDFMTETVEVHHVC